MPGRARPEPSSTTTPRTTWARPAIGQLAARATATRPALRSNARREKHLAMDTSTSAARRWRERCGRGRRRESPPARRLVQSVTERPGVVLYITKYLTVDIDLRTDAVALCRGFTSTRAPYVWRLTAHPDARSNHHPDRGR